ncbi:MAG: hypothetical protein ACREBV_01685 [Candidatus Zixiibacteriota bacterium]
MLSIDLLKASRLDDWGKALVWLLIIGFFSTLPVFLTFLFIAFSEKDISFNIIWEKGEFFLYAAALLGQPLYTLYDLKLRIINWLCIAIIVVSGFAFALMLASAVGTYLVNLQFLKNSSIVVLIVALVLTYFVRLFESVNYKLQLDEIREDQVRKLGDELDKLRE